jgi:hypothetical protein
MISLEKQLRDMHNLLLEGRMDEAIQLSTTLVADARLLNRVLVLMKEHDDALREQTKAIQERVPAAVAPQRSSKANGAAKSEAGVGRQRH